MKQVESRELKNGMTKMKRSFPVVILVGLLMPLMMVTSQAVRAEETGGSEFRLFIGHILPNQIEGVTEIMPVFGASYGLQTAAGVVELGGSNVHAEGVDFTTFSGSLAGQFPAAPDILGLVYGGLDLNYYRPVNESARKTETGVHFGTGMLLHVANTLWLRGDIKMMGGPGTSLWILFGLVFR
jgi:hypothetical protein